MALAGGNFLTYVYMHNNKITSVFYEEEAAL